jgi:pimeloyl-ACP methyl ester carboxylesterase
MNEWSLERLKDPALQGLSTGTGHRRALHVHGSWGNFYENTIATDTAAAYIANGWNYATVNTVGHDAGTIAEDLSSVADIQAWMDYFASKGTRDWVLQGHSLGALKIIKSLASKELTHEVTAVVLLSPFDLPAFYAETGDESTIQSQHRRAQELITSMGGSALVPPSLFDVWPVSLGTYLDALTIGGSLDVFQSRSGTLSHLANLGVPSLVVLGGADFAATPDNRSVRDLVETLGVSVTLIDGAPHNFAGFEEEVNAAVQRFVRELG